MARLAESCRLECFLERRRAEKPGILIEWTSVNRAHSEWIQRIVLENDGEPARCEDPRHFPYKPDVFGVVYMVEDAGSEHDIETPVIKRQRVAVESDEMSGC